MGVSAHRLHPFALSTAVEPSATAEYHLHLCKTPCNSEGQAQCNGKTCVMYREACGLPPEIPFIMTMCIVDVCLFVYHITFDC